MTETVTVHSTADGRVELFRYIDERHLGVADIKTEKIDKSAIAVDVSDAQILVAAECGFFTVIDDGNGEWSSDLPECCLESVDCGPHSSANANRLNFRRSADGLNTSVRPAYKRAARFYRKRRECHMKSRKKAAPSRATEASHRLPAFMLGDLGKGKPNITASDVPWVGEDGELPDEILRGDLGPMSSIELVFMALIAAHPIGTKRAKPDRLRDMSKALYGVKKDGPKALVADDELLVHMARNHHMDHLGFSGLKRSDAQLARDAVDALPLDHALKKRGFPESRARRLQRKFRRDFDRLMVRVSSGDFPEVIARWRIRQEIYERLARLGVKVDPTVDPCPDATPPR